MQAYGKIEEKTIKNLKSKTFFFKPGFKITNKNSHY